MRTYHSPPRRDLIVARVRASRWVEATPAPSPLHTCLNYLAEAPDVADFDYWWGQLYYLADDDRAWLATR